MSMASQEVAAEEPGVAKWFYNKQRERMMIMSSLTGLPWERDDESSHFIYVCCAAVAVTTTSHVTRLAKEKQTLRHILVLMSPMPLEASSSLQPTLFQTVIN